MRHHQQLPHAGEEAIARLDRLRHASGGTPTAQLRLNMQRTMQNDCAVFRTQQTLDEGCKNLEKVFAGRSDIRVKDRSLTWNSDLMETLEFENLILLAQATIRSAAVIAVIRTGPLSCAGSVHLGGRPPAPAPGGCSR